MTRHELLLSNVIRFNQQELLGNIARPIDMLGEAQKMKTILKLKVRLEHAKDERFNKTINSFWGTETTYPDGTRHFINKTWYE